MDDNLNKLDTPSFNKYWNQYTWWINNTCIQRQANETNYFISGHYFENKLPKTFETDLEALNYLNQIQ